MSSQTAIEYAHAEALAVSDLSPTCPRCDQVCPPGSRICDCGTWLFDDDARRERVDTWRAGLGGTRRGNHAGQPLRPAEPAALLCPVCLIASEDNYCQGCGRMLEAAADASAVAQVGRP